MGKRWWYLLFLVPLFYRPLFALFFVFFIPGFSITVNILKDSKAYEKIAFSILISLCLLVINGFFLNAVYGFSLFSVFTPLFVITLLFTGIYVFRNRKDLIPDIHFSKASLLKVLLVIFCLSILAVKVYSPHAENSYPIHVDEWYRLIGTEYLIEEGSFDGNTPNAQLEGQPKGRVRMNPGFYFILAQFYILSGVDTVLFFKFMPMIFALMTSFILFSFLTRISSYWTGLFGILFMAFMKTNENTLGIAFLVALTMSFPFLYGMFYSLNNFFTARKTIYLLIASLAYFSVLSIHEQTGAAFFPIILLYLAVMLAVSVIKKDIKLKINWKSVMIILLSVIIPAFAVYAARGLLWKGDLSASIEAFLNLIVWDGDSAINYPYNFLLFYGPLLSAFALAGLFAMIFNFKIVVFFIWTIIALGQVINFYFNNVTYFSYIQRVRHHAVLGLIPLSAAGLYLIVYHASKKIESFKDIYAKELISVILIIIISLSALSFTDDGAYFPEDKRPKNGKVIFYSIEDKDYDAIKYLSTVASEKVVLADPDVSMAVYPVSRNYVVTSTQSSGHIGDLDSVKRFFRSRTCREKEEIMKKKGADYVLSETPFRCDSLKQIYSEDFRYIYSYND